MLTRLVQAIAAVTLFIAPPAVSAATADSFVVHEWGTFTTVQGADGEQILWALPSGLDLPQFVHRAADTGVQGWTTKEAPGIVRMETPVLYFYSQQERIADVSVQFRGGNLTEWYPQATSVRSQATPDTPPAAHTRQFLIEWNGLKILPRATRDMTLDKLIRGKGSGAADHYYIARDTDANFLRMSSPLAPNGVEHERDLFYRGLGYFQAPLLVGMDADEQALSLSAREAERIDAAFLISIRQGMMRYQKIDAAISSAASVVDPNTQPFSALGDVRKVAMHDIARALVAAGLYDKEASAMVNTWQDQWFAEEGTRVLYLLPRAWTDRTLALQVAPQPDHVVRVMIGRAELITPSVERALRKQILTFKNGDSNAKSQAILAARELRLGRFLSAAITRITAGEATLSRAAWDLVGAVNARDREAERSARN